MEDCLLRRPPGQLNTRFDRTSLPFLQLRSGIIYTNGCEQGGTFEHLLKGTWVAPTSGPVLLQLLLNCDVPFFSDVQADGCQVDFHGQANTFGCEFVDGGIDNSACDSELRLTVTPGAYFALDVDGDGADESTQLTFGSAQRTDTIVIERAEVEARAAALWQAEARHRPQMGPDHAPSLNEMLVSGSEANALLTSMFTTEQQPHVIFPLSIEPISAFPGDTGHRRMQGSEPEPEPEVDGIRVSVKTQASSGEHANIIADRLISRYPDCGGPGATTADGTFDYTQCHDHSFAVCHLDTCEGHELVSPPPPSFVSDAIAAPATPTPCLATGGDGKGRRVLSSDDANRDLMAENLRLRQQLQMAMAELESLRSRAVI